MSADHFRCWKLMRFHRTWFLLAAALLIVECLIAAFVRDGFVRPYLGDVLVVIFLFFAVLAFWRVGPVPLAIGVLCFAVLIEITQAMKLIHCLGWSDNTFAKLILGNTFQWGDLLCYLAGSMASLAIVGLAGKRRTTA